MSKQTFTFTREQLTQVLEGTINLYVEYIDQHEAMRRFASLVMAAPSTNQTPLP